MKNRFVLTLIFTAVCVYSRAQDIKTKNVPDVVKAALVKKYPQANHVSWEKEKGNYEANWGGRSGEDNSVQFTPTGTFVEMEQAIPVKTLPANIATFIKTYYHDAPIKEAGKITDAAGKTYYEAEIKGKDILFDLKGSFIKESAD